jgi:hypothetical protein
MAHGTQRGLGDAVLNKEISDRLTDLHKQVIQDLAVNNPAAARAYFEKYKEDIAGDQRAEIGKYAKQATASNAGEGSAREIWATMGPKQDADPIELDKMEAKVREKFKDDDHARDAGLKAISQMAAAHNASQREREAGNTNAVMDAVRQGAGINQVRRMAEFDALPGKSKNAIEEHISSRIALLESRDSAEQARLEREQMRTFSAAYHTYSDPDVLANMTRAQVQALEPIIGRHYADSLLTKYDAIGKHAGALSEARIDNDAFKTIVRDFGFDPDKRLNLKSTSDAQEAARLGSMRDEVERQIGVEQKAKNRVLTREEKDAVARRTLSANILRSTWWGLSSEKVPAASVIPADLKKVQVPPAERDEIKAELVKRNKPVSDEEIARWYLRKQQSKR